VSYVDHGLGRLNVRAQTTPAPRTVAGTSLLNLNLFHPAVPRAPASPSLLNILTLHPPATRITPPLGIMPPGAGLPIAAVVPSPAQPADPITMTSSMDMVPASATTQLADPDPGVVDEAAPPAATDAPAAPKPGLSPVLVLGGLAALFFLSRR
jgi:hypothetical protein